MILCSALPVKGSDSASDAKTINCLLCQLANPKYHECQIIHQRVFVLWTIHLCSTAGLSQKATRARKEESI